MISSLIVIISLKYSFMHDLNWRLDLAQWLTDLAMHISWLVVHGPISLIRFIATNLFW